MAWVYRYNTTRPEDGKRVENTRLIGLCRDFPSKASVWVEIDNLGLLKQLSTQGNIPSKKLTFGVAADRFRSDELGEHHLVTKRAPSTKTTYKMYLRRFLIPAWHSYDMTKIDHVMIQKWLKQTQIEDDLSDPTVHRLKQLMSLVFSHAQWLKLIPQGMDPTKQVQTTCLSQYEAKVIDPQDAYLIWRELKAPENVLVLIAATTGMRISEILGLRWSDIDLKNGLIHVRRSWTLGKLWTTKSAASKAAMPCSPLLGEYLDGWRRETVYGQDEDWVFASDRNKGQTPRCGGMVSKDYIKQVAVKLGLVKPEERFGAHNLRHSLATFLVSLKCDIKTVQGLLRHANATTTLQLYAHGRNSDRLQAHEAAMTAFFSPVPESRVSEV